MISCEDLKKEIWKRNNALSFFIQILNILAKDLVYLVLREKCRYSEYFWSVFSRIWTEYEPEKLRNTDDFYAVWELISKNSLKSQLEDRKCLNEIQCEDQSRFFRLMKHNVHT